MEEKSLEGCSSKEVEELVEQDELRSWKTKEKMDEGEEALNRREEVKRRYEQTCG